MSPESARPGRDPQITAAVLGERLRRHAANGTTSIAASASAAAVVALSIRDSVAGAALLAWLAGVVLMNVLRLLLQHAHRRDTAGRTQAARWLALYRASLLVHGLVWGAVALLPDTLTLQGPLAVLFIALAGLAFGALSLARFDFVAAVSFAVPTLAPFSLRLFTGGAPVPGVVAVAGTAIAVLFCISALAALRTSRHGVALAEAHQGEAQRAERARSAENLLNLIFEHGGEGFAVFDAGPRLNACNARFLDMVGADPSAARPGRPPNDWVPEPASDFEPPAKSGTTVTQRRHPDGRTIEMRSSPLPGGGFVMTCVDVTLRVASERSLTEKQHMLDLLLETTAQGYWFVDNDLRTIDANPAMCRLLGLTRDQLADRNVFEFVDEANQAVLREQMALRATGVAGGYEVVLERADGTPVHCYNSATPIFDTTNRKIGAVGLFSDLTELKRAEAQVRQTGELLAQKSRVLELTLESLSQGVMSVDAHGRVNAWNRRFLELLQVPESLMLGRPTLLELARFQHGQGAFGPRLESVSESGRSGLIRFLDGEPTAIALHYQRTRADGVVIEVRSHIADEGSLVRTYTDVTASVAAQRSLAESESRFRSMADGAPALIWLSDTNGRATWFNQRWLAYTGRTMDDELSRPWSDRIDPADYERTRAAFVEARTRQRSFDVEFRVPRSDGRLAWIADNGIPRHGPEGEFIGYTGYGWDVTERKAAAQALIAAKDEAERANRAKSEFLSRMSHELRTPMNAILGFGQLLESDPHDPLTPNQLARVQELLAGGRHLLSLINEVLDLARIESGTLQLQLQAVDLGAVVDDCVRLVQPVALQRHIALTAPAAATAPVAVLADPTRLRQILLNLLSNAIKYNRDGGRVEVRWWLRPDGVRIEVLDDGPGITPADQQRLFQAFERLDAERTAIEGAGIGLALSKWLVDLMHGEIGVDSAPGRGSLFWLRLARADGGEALLPAAAVAPAEAPASVERTVLYVEDNPVNQILMEGMLSHRSGIRLLLAGLPEDGLAMAAQAPPDLVLLDIQLPGMDGFEVLRRLREQPATSAVPVIAVSANAMPGDLDDARRAGFDDYLTKPLDLHRLLEVVDRVLK